MSMHFTNEISALVRRFLLPATSVVVLALVVFGSSIGFAQDGTPVSPADCPTASPAASPGASPAAELATASPSASPAACATPATAGAEFTVVSNDIFFEPKTLTIPANTDAVVKLPNEGAAPHNFSIDALAIDVDLPAGDLSQQTTINAAAGSYEYYCNVPGHKQAGMVGTLTVQ